jgi:formate dehydrogenase beta subunit
MGSEDRGGEGPGAVVHVLVDGAPVTVEAGTSLLGVCDTAGAYVPRLCFYPGLKGCAGTVGGDDCGLCVVRLGDGSTALACCTPAAEGGRVTTDDPGLRTLRLERLAAILARHPHVCLSCPDGDGCSRDDCTYGNPPEARC